MNKNCEPKKSNLRVCVSGGHSSGDSPAYEQESYEMGRLIAKLGFCLDYGFCCRFTINNHRNPPKISYIFSPFRSCHRWLLDLLLQGTFNR